MIALCFCLAGLLSTPRQDELQRLIEDLGDEGVEKRDRATERLIRLGERSREALLRLSREGEAEKKLRAQAVLRTLDLYLELRPWYALDSRVSLAGEMTPGEAVREIERQSGQKVSGDALPPGKVRFEIHDASFWDALEAVCKASGKVSLAGGADGARVNPVAWVQPHARVSGPFRIEAGSATRRRSFDVDSGIEERTLSLGLSVAWERSIVPLRSFLALSSVQDDAGNDLTAGFEEYGKRIYAGYYPAFLEEKRVFAEGFGPTTARLPADAKRVSLNGTLTVYIRGAEGDLEFALPAEGAQTEAALDIYDDKLEAKTTAQFRLSQVRRDKSVVRCVLSIRKVDARLVSDLYNHLYLRDSAGKKYQGTPGSISLPADGRVFELEFAGVPEAAELKGLVVRLPKRAVRKDIPFRFSDILLP